MPAPRSPIQIVSPAGSTAVEGLEGGGVDTLRVDALSSQAADRMGLHDRGLLRQDMKADVVVFNPDTVQDTATYQKPDQYAKGISWVFVNGTAVVANGKPTIALPGQIVRGPGYKPGTP